MKTVTILAMLVLAATDDPETTALIARLGSARGADREAASAALEAKGRAVLPALRKASRESRDAEVRDRAAKLLSQIEHDVLTHPTMVTLDVRNQAVGDAIKVLGEKNHFDLVGDLDAVRENLLRRITLREDKPIPLLMALDRLCAAGRMRFGYGYYSDLAPDSFSRSCPLIFMAAGVSGPSSDFGPFRVKIHTVGYTLQRTRLLEREAGQGEGRVVDERLSLELQVLAEPRLLLKPAGGATILEAVDDLGRSLIVPIRPGEEPAFRGFPDPIFDLEIKLKPQSRTNALIKRLRGLIPVRVVELMPEPITVPLAGSQGKSFDGPDMTLVLQSAQLNPKALSVIELLIRSKFEDLDIEPNKPTDTQPGAFPPVPDMSIPFLMRQFFLLDEKGNGLPGWGCGIEPKGAREAKVAFIPGPTPPAGAGEAPAVNLPATLLYFGIIRTTAEIPFEFRDIPLP